MQNKEAEDKMHKLVIALKGQNQGGIKVRLVAKPLVTRKIDRNKVNRTIQQLEHMCK